MRRRALAALLAAAALLAGALVSWPVPARAAVADPTVAGPITGGLRGHALFDSWFDLTGVGYREAEYFVSGTAQSIVAGGAAAPFTTRIIVSRPVNRRQFNGTVILDWVNVTAQFENAVDTVEAHEYLLREGYAVVHVSAQAAGVCCTPLTPKVWDPVRYAALDHPGDDYAFDIFSQVAKAVRSPAGLDPTGGLEVKRVLAVGQSQSASRLYRYVREVQPSAGVIDGFLIHGGGGKDHGAAANAPVLHLLSDREASTEEPTTTTNYRLWEIAGSAHSDFWIGYHQEVGQGPRTVASVPKQPASADEELHAVAGNYGEQIHPMQGVCIAAGALFPTRYATSAAIHRLDRWVRDGTPPPMGPRYQFDGDALATDELGNALGGIRLPPIVHPVARYRSTACNLGGITIPLTDAEIAERYPTHADYYSKMLAAAKASIGDGYLLRADARDLLERACAARNRWGETGDAPCPMPGIR
jgi:hypothetical protein